MHGTSDADSPDFDAARDLLDRATNLPADERGDFVRREASDNRTLCDHVLGLLANDEGATMMANVPPAPDVHGSARSDQVHSTQTAEMLRRLERSPRLDTDRYRVEEEVDRGGMGAILKIHDGQLNRGLAMKVLLDREEPSDDYEQQLSNQMLARFLEEAQVTSQLDHPGVVPVHELGLDKQGKVFFTMRLVKGGHAGHVFHKAYRREEDWTTTRALEVILKVCDTMGFAHDKGVLHRDLKPQNVMVGRFGEVYVMDWGLAKVTGQEDQRDVRIQPTSAAAVSQIDSARQRDAASDHGASVVSMDGQKLGTPSYMPPEQARSEDLDQRADVYAIGAMMYELMTGRAPYTVPKLNKHAYRILEDVVEGPPKRIEDIQKDVPAELVAIIERAMARDREDRYADTLALAADLRAFLDDRAVQAYRTGALVELKLWVKRNKPLATSLVAAVLILVAGIAGTMVYAKRADDEAARNLGLAEEKTTLANEVQQKAAELTAKVRDFDQLSGVVESERAVADEVMLYPAWPNKIDAMNSWLQEVDALLAKEESVRNTVASLRSKALPVAPGQLDLDPAHARFSEYEALRLRVAGMRLAQDVRSGKHAWVEPELPVHLRRKTATVWDSMAWTIVEPNNSEHALSQGRLALACARAAVAAFSASYNPMLADALRKGAGRKSAQANYDRTLSWALFFCGRDQEALSIARQNVTLAGSGRAFFEKDVKELEAQIAALSGSAGEALVLAEELKLQVLTESLRSWEFGSKPDEKAAGFLHNAMVSLLEQLKLVRAKKPGVQQRLRWASELTELMHEGHDDHPTWAQARAAIAQADGVVASPLYAGKSIPLPDEAVVGLVPIGMNPVTSLWEFYDLRSACESWSDSTAIVIPQHEDDGSIKVTGATGIVFVLLPGGTMTLGSQSKDKNAPFYDRHRLVNVTLHEVTLSPFLLARHELTQGQWTRLQTWDAEHRYPSQAKAGTSNAAWGEITQSHPVELVSWNICNTLLTRHGMDLPTEAQWEYGCRAGSTTPWHIDLDDLKKVANLADASTKRVGPTWKRETWRDGHVLHAPVGSYDANDFGLHDVHGNVWEWCHDGTGLYGTERVGDGRQEQMLITVHATRGGSFTGPATEARSTRCLKLDPATRNYYVGVRAARNIML